MPEIPKELRAYKAETREKIRRGLATAIEAAAREAPKGFLTAEKVRLAAGADANACSAAYKLWRSGQVSIVDSWAGEETTAASAGQIDEAILRSRLMESIREASTDGDREAIAQELAALVAGDVIPPDAASQIKGALAEARMSAEARRENEPPPEDPRKMLLASDQAMHVARVLDRIVGDERFDRILAFVANEARADELEHPNEDEGAA